MTLQFKIQIKGITKPPVWRRVLVPADYTFHQFHKIIQAAFDWEDYHLFSFQDKEFNSRYTAISIPSDYDWEPVDDARKIKLRQVFKAKGIKLIYIYDFGDNWVHQITLEEVLKEKSSKASCIAGKGACPPEDCGSIWGYENMKSAFANDPTSEEAENFREWLGMEDGEVWDPNKFDLKERDKMVGLI